MAEPTIAGIPTKDFDKWQAERVASGRAHVNDGGTMAGAEFATPADVAAKADASALTAHTSATTGVHGIADTADLLAVVHVAADGVTDDLAAIQSAIAEAGAGGIVRLPPGEIRISGWIDLDGVDNVTLCGSGPDTVIKPIDGANTGCIRIGNSSPSSRVTIRDIAVHGNDATMDPEVKYLHGIIVRQATHVTISGCHVTRTAPYHEHNTGGSGISVENTATDVLITGNYISDPGDRCIQFAGTRVIATENICVEGFDRGIACNLQGDDGNEQLAQHFTIANNIVANMHSGSAFGLDGGRSGSPANPFGPGTIANNVVVGCKCLVHIKDIAADDMPTLIQGNISYGNFEAGIKCTNLGADMAPVQIVDNALIDTALAGISLSSGASNMQIRGNLVVRPASASGISIESDAGDHIDLIANTVLDSVGRGINVQTGNYIRLHDNRVERSGSRGIDIAAGVVAADLQGNKVRASQQEGFFLAGTNGRLIGCQGIDNGQGGSLGYGADVLGNGWTIANNDMRGNQAQGIRIRSGRSGCRVEHDQDRHGSFIDAGSGNLYNGVGAESAGAGNPPTAASWPVGAIVENTDDSTMWVRGRSGAFSRLA